MLVGVPFAFSFDLDASAINQEVQWAFRAALRDVDRKRPLASADGAKVRHGPVQTRQPQQALDEARRLAKRHSE